MTPARRAMAALALVAIAAVAVVSAAGCSDDDGDGSVLPGASDAGAPTYAVLRDDSWSLQEAIDPPADDPFASVERPPMDWYAEYVQSTPNASRMVRLSGHDSPFAEAQSELEGRGFELSDIEVDGWRAAGGAASEDPSGPDLLLLEHGDRALLVLSYEVDLAELAVLAGRIEPADLDAWTAAGGVVR